MIYQCNLLVPVIRANICILPVLYKKSIRNRGNVLNKMYVKLFFIRVNIERDGINILKYTVPVAVMVFGSMISPDWEGDDIIKGETTWAPC